jgi:hypothetical protein
MIGFLKGRIYFLIIILFFLIIIFINLTTLDAEYISMGWTIQHDEKLLLPDARAFYLKGEQRLKDYTFPVSGGFGILGPRIIQLGFKLWGFNNYGLRLFFFLFSTIATFFLILSLLHLSPNIIGFLLSLLHLLNYRYFILSHYALGEDILILFILAIVWLYLKAPPFLSENISRIAFLSGSLILLKPNFPFYCFILLGCIAVAEKFPVKKIIRLVVYSLVSLSIFLVIQGVILKKMGLLEDYLINIARAFSFYSGKGSSYFSTQVYPPPPGIMDIIPRYFELIRNWYTKGYVNTLTFFSYTKIALTDRILGITCFFLIVIVSFWLFKRRKLSKRTFALGLFLILSLVVSSKMWFYIKRVLPFFPVTFIFLLCLYQDVIKSPYSDRLRFSVKITTFIIITFLLSTQIINQAKFLFKVPPNSIKTYGIKKNSQDLAGVLPLKTTIYMHCYGFRFFWQIPQRIISGDDQIINNQIILNKAVREGGKYILLSSRGGPAKLPENYKVKLLKEYHTSAAESGIGENYRLFEIKR